MTIRYGNEGNNENGGDKDPKDGETHGGQWNV